jgi:glycine/D-amino acid oxidase-like deaminating enzyme
MLGWLIVGGGVHGTYLSHYLTRTGRATRDQLRVLDPHPRALARWDRWTVNTATEFLRSPREHHLDIADDALAQFATSRQGVASGRVATDGRRPALSLFRTHARAVIERHGLEALRVRGSARALIRHDDGWRVETDVGAIDARRIVLAIGPDDRLPWPQWATTTRARGARIAHVLDADFSRESIGADEHVLVVGGGISAAQLALRLAQRTGGAVTLLARHAPRVHTLDADLPWFGRGGPAAFARATDPRARRTMLGLGRRRGSMPKDTATRIASAVKAGRLALQYGEVARATNLADGRVRVETADQGLACDRIVLATGFATQRPGGTWLARTIRSEGLPIAPCGYPIADGSLAWRPGLHVCGPLAELQLGAAARSIAGVRRAAEILGATT